MKILAIEPFYSGSHKSFLDSWVERSKHDWTILGYPGYKWKWRMRHTPYTAAMQIKEWIKSGEHWDLLFCSDMLALHELKGLLPEISDLPSICYFHENQFTYPEQDEAQRDFQYAFTNLLTASAADEVWFNSQYHLDEFLSAATLFLERMPDYSPQEIPELIREKSTVQYPGVEFVGGVSTEKLKNENEPIHIVWAARWEFDKNPETFFAALRILKNENHLFSISVLGEQFKNSPIEFSKANIEFADHILHFGYLEKEEDYFSVLQAADVFVSTAIHEFFGITCVQAIANGCYPIVPNALAYPETVGQLSTLQEESFFYDGSVEQLVEKLKTLISKHQKGKKLFDALAAANSMQKFHIDQRAKEMDARIDHFLQTTDTQ